MNDAIQQRVERFVQEILGLVEEVSTERRAAALSVISTLLADAGRSPEARTASPRRAPASATGRALRKAAASPKNGQGRRRGTRGPASDEVVPTAVAPSSPASSSHGAAGYATRRRTRSTESEAVMPMAVAPPGATDEAEGPPTLRTPSPVGEAPALAVASAGLAITSNGTASPAPNVAPASPASASSVTAAPVPEREALVLDSVHALGRATASEVAGRSGQPNGSVSVALRALVARGLVAKTQTPRGMEYSLPAMTAVA